MLQEKFICKRKHAKNLPELEAVLEKRNENLKEDIRHISSEFMELKAFIESEFTDIKNYVKKNVDNGGSTSQFERLVGNMESEIVFLAGRN